MNILHGDCREQLATLPDDSVDAIVTDPPYELGFMGKRWDATGIAYDHEVWSQCLRVLKPGGHVLAFGGTRTYHRMVCAIEDAGFEIRDSIHWLYGSGFPKSMDVAKAIDKTLRAEREVVGVRTLNGYGKANERNGQQQRITTEFAETSPVAATDEAAQWDGWGTALKPAHEPIVLARKPLVGTVAANVMEYGTGALNIDATRIGMGDEYDPAMMQRQQVAGPSGFRMAASKIGTEIPMYKPGGRWPANLILTHSPDCQQTGTGTSRVVDRERGRRPSSGIGSVGGPKGDPMPNGPTYADTPETWDCVAGCPVAALNTQSGNSSSPRGTITQGGDHFSVGSDKRTRGTQFQGHGDSGGASRFFTTTEWDPDIDVPFLYVAKPSRRERNAGLDGMPKRDRNDQSSWLRECGVCGCRFTDPTTGKPKCDHDDVRFTPPSPIANFHPTVKPVALMRHLVRLVTPPGGTVLDPFLGSGTTAVAATLEGFQWIGCELTDDYLPIIEARTTWAEQNRPEPDLTLFTEQP